MTVSSASADALPLLDWRERAEAARLGAERDTLAARVRGLPPRSFRRIRLEARLAELTERQLATESSARTS